MKLILTKRRSNHGSQNSNTDIQKNTPFNGIVTIDDPKEVPITTGTPHTMAGDHEELSSP